MALDPVCDRELEIGILGIPVRVAMGELVNFVVVGSWDISSLPAYETLLHDVVVQEWIVNSIPYRGE